jgi:hypothetical protein
VQVGEDQEETREDKGRQDGEEASIPDGFRVKADDGGGAEAESKRSHEANRGEDAEGGKEEMTGVKEVGMHVSEWVGGRRVRRAEDRPAGPYVESLVNPS